MTTSNPYDGDITIFERLDALAEQISQEMISMLDTPYYTDIVNSQEFVGVTAQLSANLDDHYGAVTGTRDLEMAMSVVALTLALIDRPLHKVPAPNPPEKRT